MAGLRGAAFAATPAPRRTGLGTGDFLAHFDFSWRRADELRVTLYPRPTVRPTSAYARLMGGEAVEAA